jgi:hypothetical protein
MKSHLKVILFACDKHFPYKEEVTGSNYDLKGPIAIEFDF